MKSMLESMLLLVEIQVSVLYIFARSKSAALHDSLIRFYATMDSHY